MSCNSCGVSSCRGACYEARLSLGLSSDYASIIGSLDGVYIKPIPLSLAVKANETNTSLKYDLSKRMLVYQNEKSKNGKGSPDFITTRELLSGSTLDEIGGVQALVDGGLASVIEVDDQLVLQFSIPQPVGIGENSSGFITYVSNPADGVHYKSIRPDPGGTSDTLLIGHPNGSVEFASPIVSPVLIPLASLTSNGAFSGVPSVSSGVWRYQQMGQSQVITNTSGSVVEVELTLGWSMQTAGTRSGFYASLVNGGSDYKTTFVQGQTNIKQEGYPGGRGSWKVTLNPGERCQFLFGGWTNAAGNMVITVGSVDEAAGVTKQTVYQPIITVKRLI